MDLDQEMVERQRFHLQIHAQLQPMCRQFNDSKANAPISPDWDTVVLGPSPFHILPAPDAEFQYDDSFSDTMPPDLNGRMLAFEPLCECIVKMLFSFGDAEEPSPAVIITLIDYVRDWLTPVACLRTHFRLFRVVSKFLCDLNDRICSSSANRRAQSTCTAGKAFPRHLQHVFFLSTITVHYICRLTT
jgi:hypothetical protein